MFVSVHKMGKMRCKNCEIEKDTVECCEVWCVCVVCLCVCVCMCVRVCWARVCATLHPKDLQVTNLVALIMYRISFERCKILAREPQGSRANIFAP